MTRVRPGEWVQPIRRGYKMACCDCDLVHTVNFRVRKGKIQMQAFRDEQATADERLKTFDLMNEVFDQELSILEQGARDYAEATGYVG